jgi:hypothetical protein
MHTFIVYTSCVYIVHNFFSLQILLLCRSNTIKTLNLTACLPKIHFNIILLDPRSFKNAFFTTKMGIQKMFAVLFNDAFSVNTTNKRVELKGDKWMMNWRRFGRKRSWPNFMTLSPAFVWSDWGKPIKRVTMAEAGTRDLPNTKQECENVSVVCVRIIYSYLNMTHIQTTINSTKHRNTSPSPKSVTPLWIYYVLRSCKPLTPLKDNIPTAWIVLARLYFSMQVSI